MELIINNIPIKQEEGLYNVNDLYNAYTGKGKKVRPNQWLRNKDNRTYVEFRERKQAANLQHGPIDKQGIMYADLCICICMVVILAYIGSYYSIGISICLYCIINYTG